MVNFRPYDPVNYLKTEADIMYYFAAIAEDNDPVLTAAALGDVARARGMSQLARETGISRMGLIKALSADGNPSFATVTKVLDALGYRFDIVPKAQSEKKDESRSDGGVSESRILETPSSPRP
jgi:probable addiction module antidote protein